MEILIAITWFIVIVAVVNWLQIVRHYRYGSHWYFHLPILAIGIAGLFWLHPATLSFYSNSIGLVVGCFAVSLFLLDERFRNRYYEPSNYFTAASVRPGYDNLFQPPFMSSVVKVEEVFFQNLTLLLLIVFTQSIFSNWWQAGLLLSIISFLLHVPAIKTFNWWYGGLFTVLSTVFIFFTPWLVQKFSYGIHIVFAIHLLMYPVMMHVSYVLGKHGE